VHWHIVTGEFPPAPGGVSDYSEAVSRALAAAGDTVDVWCPASSGVRTPRLDVRVHDIAGQWTRADLATLDAALDQTAGPRTLLVQWVPHAFGRRSINIGVCRWLRRRALAGDSLQLMVHEPGLGFGEGLLRHNAAAGIHRAMLMLLLSAAERVWVAIPAWADILRSCSLGRDIPVCWLPIPSTISVATCPDGVAAARHALTSVPEAIVVGHFSTYSRELRNDLRCVLPVLLQRASQLCIQLLGRGSTEFLGELSDIPNISARVTASGDVDALELSYRLQACDLMLQPYRDGASTRRTTLMAALAHGIPVVTTIGRLSERFWQTSDIVVGTSGEPRAMATAVLDLACDPDRRRRLGSAARAEYERRFSLTHVIDALRTGACEAV
jgi:glycosyltransferase involved in cell wall biosynthesis